MNIIDKDKKMWKNRRVLITGASGLLGGHLTKDIIDSDADVVTIVRDYVPKAQYNSQELYTLVNEVDGNIENFDLVNRVINEYQIQTVFHLAAQTQVGMANNNPIPTLKTNILGTINILEACRINKVDQVLVASSDKAYGQSPYLPYDEDTPLRGLHPYDASKTCADILAQTYANTYNMCVGITRCGNLFGEGDLNFNRIVPGTIRSLLQNESPVIRSDGSMIRDYFYVKDAVSAYKTLAEFMHKRSDESKRKARIYNFSYGKPLSVLSMVQNISDIMNIHIEPTILNQTDNEIHAQYLNSFKAKTFLDWTPKWTLEDALKETIEWYKDNI